MPPRPPRRAHCMIRRAHCMTPRARAPAQNEARLVDFGKGVTSLSFAPNHMVPPPPPFPSSSAPLLLPPPLPLPP